MMPHTRADQRALWKGERELLPELGKPGIPSRGPGLIIAERLALGGVYPLSVAGQWHRTRLTTAHAPPPVIDPVVLTS